MSDNSNKTKLILLGDKTVAGIWAFVGCIGCIGIMPQKDSLAYTNSFFAVLVWGLGFYALTRILPFFRDAVRRDKAYAYVFSALVSIALHMGAMLEVSDNVNFKNVWMYIEIICFMVFLAPFTHYLWNLFFVVRQAGGESKKKDEKPLGFTSVWLIIFLLWIPVFMAFYPGAFVYDATDEYVEVISRQFTMHHPLIHVLLLGGIVHLGEYLGLGANAGIAAYTLLQMAVMSSIFAYMVICLQRFGVKKKALLGVILFVGLFPVFPMYAVCSAKDTLFSGAFLVIILLLLQYAKDREAFFNRKMILFVIASTAMMLLRNNGYYAYIVAVPIIVICFIAAGNSRKQWIKIVILMILSVCLYKGSSFCIQKVLSASDNEHQEILTVPIQQLARVYKYSPEIFSEEEKASLYAILPENYLITYTPRCSDVLKSGFNNKSYENNPSKYRKLWMNIGLRKPIIYINAWLVNSYGYWYPDAIINGYGGNQMYTYQYVDSSYFGFETEPPGERKSMIPLLEELYRNISLELFQQRMPVISMMFAPGFVLMIFAWFFCGLMRQKRWMFVATYIPVLLLWGTVLLGPTVLVRYVLILWFVIPLMLINSEKEKY